MSTNLDFHPSEKQKIALQFQNLQTINNKPDPNLCIFKNCPKFRNYIFFVDVKVLTLILSTSFFEGMPV